VLLANKAGKVVWTGGGYITCARNLPTCGGTTTTAQAVLEGAVGKPARFVSCPSGPGVNTVGWAMGPVPVSAGKPDLGLSYVAVMEGERALPGREVAGAGGRGVRERGALRPPTCPHLTAARSVAPTGGGGRPLPLWGKTIAKRSVGGKC
jgi:hypothetical protein